MAVITLRIVTPFDNADEADELFDILSEVSIENSYGWTIIIDDVD